MINQNGEIMIESRVAALRHDICAGISRWSMCPGRLTSPRWILPVLLCLTLACPRWARSDEVPLGQFKGVPVVVGTPRYWHAGEVSTTVFLNDSTLCSAAVDGVIKIWNLK